MLLQQISVQLHLDALTTLLPDTALHIKGSEQQQQQQQQQQCHGSTTSCSAMLLMPSGLQTACQLHVLPQGLQ